MRDRSLIHFNHLAELTAWAIEQGWVQEPTKDFYEVLRLRRGKDVAIFHQKTDAKEHVTVWGASAKLGREFLRAKKARDAEQSA